MIRLADDVIAAASTTAAIATLIPGYMDLDDDQALLARWEVCVDVAVTRQAVAAAEAARVGLFDPGVETEEMLTALFANKAQPVEIRQWTHPAVPLFAIRTDFEPFVPSRPLPLAAPESAGIVWMDPSDETVFLLALQRAGILAEASAYDVA